MSQLIGVFCFDHLLPLAATCPLTCLLSIPALCLVSAFFIGGIPFGFLAGKIKGIDIRTKGSGNIGATNVYRTLGKGWGTAVFLADFLKGFAPTLVSISFPSLSGSIPADAFATLIALTTVLGHSFTPYLKFKGGKGVATSAGVILAMMPLPFICSAFTWYVASKISRYVSLSSIIAAIVLPLATWYFHSEQRWYIVFSLVLGVLVIIRHQANIKRLIAGTEAKIGQTAK